MSNMWSKVHDLTSAIGPRLRRLRTEVADHGQPLPTWAQVTLAALVSTCLFLTLRLVVVHWARPAPLAPRGHAVAPLAQAGGAGPRPELRPPASPEAFAALVERWRMAWVDKDLRRYIELYASTFGAQGRDRADLTEYKREVFASAEPIQVEVSDLQVSLRRDIAIVSFDQAYRSGRYRDRGRKTLYLVAEDGEWRVFNEEFVPEQ
jgi:ketosteroid isomerase-like protein